MPRVFAGATTSRVRSSSLVEVMIDQLPMLRERGLRDLQMSIARELCFRGDVRENNEEVEAEHRARGGKGSGLPTPEEMAAVDAALSGPGPHED